MLVFCVPLTLKVSALTPTAVLPSAVLRASALPTDGRVGVGGGVAGEGKKTNSRVVKARRVAA